MMDKDLPEGWTYVRIGDAFMSVNDKIEPDGSQSYKYVGLEHLAKGGGIESIGDSTSLKSTKTLFKSGDVLYGKLRPYLNKRAIADFDGVCSTDILVFRGRSIDSSKFLYYYLGTNEVLAFANENSQGINLPRVSGKVMENLTLPLSPLAEQKRIAAKLDAAFAHLERIKASLARIPELLKRFREAVLTQAVTGKLTEEWREGNTNVEAAQIFFEKLIQERKNRYTDLCNEAKKLGKKKARKIFLEQIPKIKTIAIDDLPNTWSITNIEFLAFVTKLAGFEYTKHIKFKDNGDIPVVRAQNVKMGRFIEDNLVYIDESVSNYLERSQLHGRELLMVFIGAGTGDVCLAPKNRRWHLAPNVAKIDTDGINVEFLHYYLQSSQGQSSTMSFIKATAQPSLSMDTIRKIIVRVPPLPEQQEIVNRVETLFATIDAIESQYNSLKQKIDTLPQAILSKAFRGELVPQNPDDEPAAVLLEKIRNEMGKLGKKGKKQGVLDLVEG